MKAIDKLHLVLSSSTGNTVIHTPYVRLLIDQAESFGDFEIIDLSNESLVNRLNQLTPDELCWFLMENKKSMFVYCEGKLDLLERIIAARHNSLCVYVARNKVFTGALLEKHPKMEPFIWLLPKVIDYLSEMGVLNAGEYLKNQLVFGMCTETHRDRAVLLNEQAMEAYMALKNKTKKGKKTAILRLFSLLALEATHTILFSEIAARIRTDNETAQRYVSLLEQSGYIYRLSTYHSNQRYEFLKGNAIVFLDNGILNAHGVGFKELGHRNDEEQLWRNWAIAELIKKGKVSGANNQYCFWQSHTGQRIDLIIFSILKRPEAFVFTWNTKLKKKTSPLFNKYYPGIQVKQVTPLNYISVFNT